MLSKRIELEDQSHKRFRLFPNMSDMTIWLSNLEVQPLDLRSRIDEILINEI